MIKYKRDILAALKAAGISQYAIRKQKLFGQAELSDMRRGRVGSLTVISRLCHLLHCQPGDILEYIPGEAKDGEAE